MRFYSFMDHCLVTTAIKSFSGRYSFSVERRILSKEDRRSIPLSSNILWRSHVKISWKENRRGEGIHHTSNLCKLSPSERREWTSKWLSRNILILSSIHKISASIQNSSPRMLQFSLPRAKRVHIFGARKSATESFRVSLHNIPLVMVQWSSSWKKSSETSYVFWKSLEQ